MSCCVPGNKLLANSTICTVVSGLQLLIIFARSTGTFKPCVFLEVLTSGGQRRTICQVCWTIFILVKRRGVGD